MDRMSRTITPEQLAERWHTSRSYLANLRSQRKGCSYFRRGRSILYYVKDVEQYEKDRFVVTKFVRPKVAK
jgi:hypothetical protein